jgi:uncharacterized membrane protein YebE (DUF533 family)
MSDKKGANPLYMGLGVLAGAVGAVGAILLSKKENRKKAAKLVKNAGNVGGDKLEMVLQKVREALTDIDAFNKQETLDKPKKVAVKKK